MDSDLRTLMGSFKNYFKMYDKFVIQNPRIAAEVEAIIRWASFLISTKKSPVLGELVSSSANLLQLCNDIILKQANPQLKIQLSNYASQLKTSLTVIQSLELLAEIYARDTYGAVGKWTVITVIQITKAAIKLVLLFVFDQGLTRSQSTVPLDRIHYSEILKLQEKFPNLDLDSLDKCEDVKLPSESSTKSIVLKSTGRKIRSITGAPPKESRFTSDANSTDPSEPFNRVQKQRLRFLLMRYKDHKSAVLTEKQIYGELLHISRPLAHLALMGAFGTKSWLSYFASLAMDISSLYLVRSPLPLPSTVTEQNHDFGQPIIPQCYKFNVNERMELGQRASSLLLYLLRSPFFDDYTKQRALEGLASSAESIPLIGHFMATMVNYIPEWQKDYFRVWSE